MKFIKRIFSLQETERLFDTKEYILKAFIATLLAVLIGQHMYYMKSDMISVLFGMFLVLEPLNISGLRSGLSQIQASIIGALVSSIVILTFGYTPLTTALSLALTVYLVFRINKRSLLVVAVFTSIYMNSFIQTGPNLTNTIFNTIVLRIFALSSGVLVAMVVNYLFSIFGYKSMTKKRLTFLFKSVENNFSKLIKDLKNKNMEELNQRSIDISDLFNEINFVQSNFKDLQSDQKHFKAYQTEDNIDSSLFYINYLSDINLELFDLSRRVYYDNEIYTSLEFIRELEEKFQYYQLVTSLILSNQTILDEVKEVSEFSWMEQFSKVLNSIKEK